MRVLTNHAWCVISDIFDNFVSNFWKIFVKNLENAMTQYSYDFFIRIFSNRIGSDRKSYEKIVTDRNRHGS